MNDDRLIGDAVGVIIEKVLMEIGLTTHNKMVEILEGYNMTFSDCYRKPDVLNSALREIFGNAYLDPVGKIRNELMRLNDDSGIREFIKLVSES